jgi:hypothetical protein
VPAARISDAALTSRTLPCGDRQQNHAGDPDRVQPGALDERLVGDPVQVEAVGDREQDQPATDQRPGPARPPRAQREGADDEGDQEQVAERIGEVRRDDGRRAAGIRDHRRDHHGGSDRADGQDADEPVQPSARPDSAQARTNQQHQRDVRRRVEAQVQHIGPRGVRRRLEHLDEDAPVDRAQGPGQHPAAQDGPDQPVGADEHRACDAHRGRRHEHAAEQPRREQARAADAPRAGGHVQQVQDPREDHGGCRDVDQACASRSRIGCQRQAPSYVRSSSHTCSCRCTQRNR